MGELADQIRLLKERYGRAMGPLYWFDPEGEGYNYDQAIKYGIDPDSTGHWYSRVPETAEILKGRGHKTFRETEDADRRMGYRHVKIGNRVYSIPMEED